MTQLRINPRLCLPLDEVHLSAIRAQGAGGQNINKTANAAQLRFDVGASSLPEDCKQRLLQAGGQPLTRDGVIVIKAQEHRSLEMNRDAALQRLAAMIRRAAVAPKIRKATKPSRAQRQQRLEGKTRRGAVKSLRRKPVD
ncbi:aminoacyl-tRNA hydrolase [Solimonas fluminis]|uniref:Aminoacyl-tRNA hydrolase n=1 Tax=Solimonas fluminis TaxID=2086571 RepID=A0A2S5TB85_9GAMM|nr:alternative ribosome rescue aminoacyl-tRNA hydrolase ArfB [Solimonas fluminis]PPE72127.1 aminoacyl-tRNA hydrolase [Solimonas fluminis]